MSRLEAIVRSLCEVVLSYCEIQTGRKEPIEQYLNQAHSEFMTTFQSIVKEVSIHANTRSSLLDYLMSEIQFLKPLVEQPSLSEEDALKVHQRLYYLIDNVNHLIQMPQTSSLSATPATSQHHKLFGLLRGIFKRQSNLSNFGELLKCKFFDPLCIEPYKNNSPILKDFMKKLIEEHLSQLKSTNSGDLQEEVSTLKAANDTFLLEIGSLKTAYTTLEETNKSLEEQVKQLQNQLQDSLKASQATTAPNSLVLDTDSVDTEFSENKSLNHIEKEALTKEEPKKEASLLFKFGMIYGHPLSSMLSAAAANQNNNASQPKDSPNIQPKVN